jgi:hypothetical protein
MMEDSVKEVTRLVRQKINSADIDTNIKELLIELIQFEMRNMHRESSSYTKEYEKRIREFM